jgi:hypothetical protein
MRTLGQSLARWGPVALSLSACLLVSVAITTGGGRGLRDEGAAAHLWQVLIGLQVPWIAVFLFTCDWRRPGQVAKILALQIAAIGCAMAPVALLRL